MPWRQPLNPLWQGPGTAVTAAALTSGLLGGGGLPLLSPSQLVPGSKLTIEAAGELTSTSATPTVVFAPYIGPPGAIGSKILLGATSALVINVAATAWPWMLKWKGTFRTLSDTVGVIQGTGSFKSGFAASGGLAAQWAEFPFPITAALRIVSTLNTGITNELDLGVTLSVTTGSPSVTVTQFDAEIEAPI